MGSKHDTLYMDMAHVTSWQSHDEQYKVGSVIVKDGQVLSQGWNGTPSGMDNTTRHHTGATKKEVIHSEANALMKLARNGGGSKDATIYCTHSPCWDCAKLIIQAGITRVVFDQVYDVESWQFLKERLGEDNVNGGIKPSSRVSTERTEETG